ncbi:MAG: patatin-like phospholipase family protein, partial [Pseudomonadota bacterium]|nr:patatin-like phospholipase family protein [Pseudomonadota bacterium]
MSLSRFFIILTLLLSFNVIAADHLKPRPKIGLALSGGGARGLAHIGVLKGLEQLQVPIDYIAGTSMGSIIGGLYASGLSIEALRQAVEQEIDWQSVLDYNIERDQLSYREKRSQRRYFDIELGLNQHGLTTPPGFIGGQELFLVLKRLTRSINIDDFSNLPIPFTAVATDLNSGQPHLLKKGNLAWALRASMAVPSAFSPVKMEGRVLADGGIVNNIPVDVVREMGADVVIAVDIAVPLSQVDSNSSLITIAQQSLDVALIQNALLALRQADIVIAPDLTGFSRTDFDQGHTLITRGHQAIRDKTALLTQLAVDAPTYARYRQRLQARMPTIQHAVTPQFIEIKGHQRTAEAFLRQKLYPLIGQKVLFKALEHTTKQLMSLGEFEQITYDVIENAQGETGLLFEFREKPWGPHYFRLGFNAATQFDDKTELTFLLRHERMNINRLGAEWLNEIEVGSGYLIHSEFYQPLDYHKRYFLAPAIAFERAFTD